MILDTLTLETPRLLLRPPRRHDFEEFAVFLGDAETMRHLGSAAQPRSVAWRTFLTMAGAWAMQGFAMFSVIEKATGRWVGRVGPWQPEGWPGTEVGWGIGRDRCRLGYATEAATAAIDWAFAELGWTEVIHVIDTENVASQRVARKLGSRNRGRGLLARAVRGQRHRHLGPNQNGVALPPPERVTRTPAALPRQEQKPARDAIRVPPV